MNFIKKHSSLLIACGILLFAVLLFVPTRLMQGSIKKKMNGSISLSQKVSLLSRDVIASGQWQQEKQYQDSHMADANSIVAISNQATKRAVVSSKIFPSPQEVSVQIFNNFGRDYKVALDHLIKKMNALDCPSDADIRKMIPTASPQILTSRSSAGVRGVGSRGADEAILDFLCQNRAESISVYANPLTFSGYIFWDDYIYSGLEKAVEDCWYYQLAYWIQSDVAETISKINSRSQNVFSSPVKRLMGISFRNPDALAPASGENRPMYIVASNFGLVSPWTGRWCNEDIDVVHFSLAVVVRSKSVLSFMKELCGDKEHGFIESGNESDKENYKHNQITILQSDIKSFNRSDPAHGLYSYGDDAVVKLNLVCEYIFKREGYDDLKPDSVKELLGQLEGNEAESDKGSRRRRR